MSRIMQLSVCCLMISAGCTSTGGLTSWMQRDAPKTADSSNPGTQPRGGLPAASQAQQPERSEALPDTVDEHVKIGQKAVASWYGDRQPHHLATARMHFEEALQQRPQQAGAHHGLAIVSDLERKYADAERHYQLALAQAPNDSKILGDLGYSYLLQDRLDDGEKYLLRALQADEGNQNATKHLGDVYARQGKTGLAERTYNKVLSSEQTQQALAKNSRSSRSEAQEKEGSLIGKLVPKKAEESDLTAEIKQRMDRQRHAAEIERQMESQRQEMRQPKLAQTPPGFQPPPRLHPEEQLKHQLAEIDRERHRNHHDGPIMIDHQGGTRRHAADAPSTPDWANEQPQAAHVSSHQQAGYDERGQFSDPHRSASSPERHPPQHDSWSHDSTSVAAREQDSPWSRNSGADRGIHGAEPNPGAPPSHPHAGSDPLTNPWGGVAPARGTASAHGVSPALHEQRQGHPYDDRRTLPGPTALAASPYQQASSSPSNPNRNPPRQNSTRGMHEASKTAARLGMGLGPGAMFPVFESTPMLSSSGTNSHWNGESYPAPHRVLPTDLPPQDLNQAFSRSGQGSDDGLRSDSRSGFGAGNQSQPVNHPPHPPGHRHTSQMAPPPNQQGQQMPSASPPTYSQDQFGTASRYNDAARQGMGYPAANLSQPSLRSYDEQRERADQQLNQAVQHAWGERQMNSAVNPANGQQSQWNSPPVQGGMMDERADAGRSQQSSWPRTSSAPDGAPNRYDPDHSDPVVVPPPYRPSEQGTAPRHLPDAASYGRQPQFDPHAGGANSSSRTHSHDGWPQIIPGNF